MTEIIPCPLCAVTEHEDIYSFDDGVSICKCLACGFVYTSPRLRKESRDKFYESGYFHGTSDININIDYTKNSTIFANDAAERVKLLNKYLPPQKNKVLEIGSAAGFFLKALKDKGFDAVGLELSAEMCAYAKDNFAVDCRCENIEKSSLPDSYFDAVALWHVLEHLENPLETLKLLNSKLTDKGMLFITVPNFNSGNSRRLGANWGHLQPKVHLSHFTRESIEHMLSKAGFKIVSMTKSGGTGFFGKGSKARNRLKNFIAKNISKFNLPRKIIKYFIVNYLGKDDFITVVGRKCPKTIPVEI